jgi:hypothetical protein
LYQSRAGAFDSPNPTSRAIANKLPRQAVQDDEKKRAEQARDREQLLSELEKARKEIAKLRAEAEAQRQRAESALQEARAWRDHVWQAEKSARKQTEKGRNAEAVERVADPDVLYQKGYPTKALADLDAREAKLRRYFQEQLKKLEEQQRKELDQLRLKRAELLGQNATKPPPRGGNELSDKLDRILERLERLEKRLDNLERRKQ